MTALGIISMNHSKRYEIPDDEPEVLKFMDALNWLRENDPDFRQWMRESVTNEQGEWTRKMFARYAELSDPRTPEQRGWDDDYADLKATQESARP